MRQSILSLRQLAPRLLPIKADHCHGVVVACVGLLIEVEGLNAPVGAFVRIQSDGMASDAQVVGFRQSRLLLMPLSPTDGMLVGADVRLSDEVSWVDADLALGRILNARGEALDGGSAVRGPGQVRRTLNPLSRPPISTPMSVGVRAIDGLLTVGRGQRLGLFAGSGVGKSALLGMLARGCDADVIVVGMIGERSREVQEFIADNLADVMDKCVVVVSPADDPPALRLRGAWLASELAEQYRAQGKQVLLLMDSLTRFAQAQREIGLALSEPATSKGYPPSVFAALPQLVERAGTTDSGSITAFYTVLMEEDDLQDPVVDAARAILDGHVVLSRELADSGVYPAIDIGASVSRLQPKLVAPPVLQNSLRFKSLWARYAEQRDLINIGAYKAGADPATDEAIRLRDAMLDYVRQGLADTIPSEQAQTHLSSLFAEAQTVPATVSDGPVAEAHAPV